MFSACARTGEGIDPGVSSIATFFLIFHTPPLLGRIHASDCEESHDVFQAPQYAVGSLNVVLKSWFLVH